MTGIWDGRKLLGELRPYLRELEDVATRAARKPRRVRPAGAGRCTGFDAFAYYGLVRHLRPQHVVEAGVGWSTLMLRRALEANGDSADVTLIDPFPDPTLVGDLRPGWRTIESMVQNADLTVFDGLRAGDILFYDGSHCVQTAGDVNWMLLEVMPRVAEGVWFHFHDIFWPADYPASWLLDDGLSWNEQYALQAFLMHNEAWRPRLAVSLLRSTRRHLFADLADPRWPYDGGASVWLEKVSA